MLVGYVTIDNGIEKFLQHHAQSRALLHAQRHEIATINGKVLDAEDRLGIELLVHELLRFGKCNAHGTFNHLATSDTTLIATSDGEELLGMLRAMLHEETPHSTFGIGDMEHVMGDEMRHGLALRTGELEASADFVGNRLANLGMTVHVSDTLLIKGQAMGLAHIMQKNGEPHDRIHVGWRCLQRVQTMLPHVIAMEGGCAGRTRTRRQARE